MASWISYLFDYVIVTKFVTVSVTLGKTKTCKMLILLHLDISYK